MNEQTTQTNPTLDVTLKIRHDKFTDEKGNLKPYVSFKFDLGGATFAVSVKDNDKRLLNYILQQQGFYNEESK